MEEGREETAAEYRQLWDISVSALEQFAAILGDSPMDMEEFGRLFLLMLSKYDIGTIPVSLDRVSAGDFDRNRRRSLKHLIVLGASGRAFALCPGAGGGLLPGGAAAAAGAGAGPGGCGELSCGGSSPSYITALSLPSESLLLSCPLRDSEGAELRPAFVFNRAKAVFGLEEKRAELARLRMAAEGPALSLAAAAVRGGGSREQAAAEYFRRRQPERMARLEAAAALGRGRLSPAMVKSSMASACVSAPPG